MIFMKPTGCQVTAPASISCAVSADAVLMGGKTGYVITKHEPPANSILYSLQEVPVLYNWGRVYEKKFCINSGWGFPLLMVIIYRDFMFIF